MTIPPLVFFVLFLLKMALEHSDRSQHRVQKEPAFGSATSRYGSLEAMEMRNRYQAC